MIKVDVLLVTSKIQLNLVTSQIRLNLEPNQNVTGYPNKSVNPNLTRKDLFLGVFRWKINTVIYA